MANTAVNTSEGLGEGLGAVPTPLRPGGAWSDRVWNTILRDIGQGAAVPIVGDSLLTVSGEGGATTELFPWIARRLEQEFGLRDPNTPPNLPLRTVIPQINASFSDVNSFLHDLRLGDQIPIPEPLRKLARIEPLKLFVTSTFDPLLARAINEARFGGQAKTKVLSYAPSMMEDLPADGGEVATVFHLLGKLEGGPFYALTDEDVLEYLRLLQVDRPKRLFGALASKSLLFIGGTFPDWLARFVLRTARDNRLSECKFMSVVADDQLRNDASLARFLSSFSRDTKVFPGTAVEFVDELSRRWSNVAASAAPVKAPKIDRPSNGQPKEVFISYAREDREAANELQRALQGAGMSTWLDSSDLDPGAPFPSEIEAAISGCRFFLPVLSRNTLVPEGYFRREWKAAEERALGIADALTFVVPIAVESIDRGSRMLPKRWREQLNIAEALDSGARQSVARALAGQQPLRVAG